MSALDAVLDVRTGQLTVRDTGEEIDGDKLELWAEAEFGLERADRALAELGYRRLGEWLGSSEVYGCVLEER